MRAATLQQLRAEIQRIEGRPAAFDTGTEQCAYAPDKATAAPDSGEVGGWRLGAQAVDRHFSSGLSPAALHEITPAGYGHSWAALAFTLALLSRRLQQSDGDVLWCFSSQDSAEFGQPYGPGLGRFHLDPTRFIFVETANRQQTAFVLEESLRSGRLAAIVAQTPAFDFTISRRLSLAASDGRAPALLVTKPCAVGDRTSATRWRVGNCPPISPLPARQQLHNAPSLYQFSWQVELLRNRHGPAGGSWSLTFPLHNPYAQTQSRPYAQAHNQTNHDQAFCFHSSAPACNRTIAAA